MLPVSVGSASLAEQATRSADLYVFCLYPERDKSKTNVLEVLAWEFYVVPTEILNQGFAGAKSVSLTAVKRVAVPCKLEAGQLCFDAPSRR